MTQGEKGARREQRTNAMSIAEIQQHPEALAEERASQVNDFAFMVATKNGSGSQTSNNVLVRALFHMGIPVNGKNLFPSNIKGLPTWYTIRVSGEGYIARRDTTEIVIAMNELTAAEDIASLPAGGVVILPQEWKWGNSRDDITCYEIPVRATIRQFKIPSARREQVGNMVYVGVVAWLFEIPLELVHQALSEQFRGKAAPINMNYEIIETAWEWARSNLIKQDPYRFAPLSLTKGKILITGNEAAALGAIFGGVTFASWYPITPSTSLIDSLLSFRHLRKDPETGKDTVAVIQAEDEIAAIGMVVGARLGWRARHDGHQRPGYQPDGRICRPRLPGRNPGGYLGRHAHGPQYRSAHPHQPGRHSLHQLPRPRRQPAGDPAAA